MIAAALAMTQVLDDTAAVAQLFHDACTKGEVRLGKDRVEVLDRNPTPYPPGREGGVSFGAERSTYLKIKQPANTFVTMITYRAGSRRKIASTCIVVTRALTRDEAFAAFLSTSKGDRPTKQMYWADRWDVDHMDLGYRKRFAFERDGWAYFTTETYQTPTRH
jgi:hypothetical protein